MTDFFKHGNKVYSENLNDGILVGNSFDWTVDISLPGDTGGVFPNTTTVVKAKVADCSITPNSNLSIGETITNNAGSSQVYRLTVYPNFNRFGGFTFVSLEGDGSVIITEVGASSPIRNNLDYSDLGDVVELKQLKEYDIVVTIPSGGEVTGLSFGFKSSSADVTASISQANVSGLVDDLSDLQEGKADVGHLHTTASVASSDALPNIGTSAGATQRMINEAVDEMVGSLDNSITNTYHWNYQNSQGSGQVTYDNDGVVVNAYRRGNTVTVRVRVDIKYINMGSDTASLSLATLPSGYRPPIQLYSLNAIYPYFTMFRYGSVNTNGQINLNVKGATSVQTVNAWIDLAFTYVTTEDAPSQ